LVRMCGAQLVQQNVGKPVHRNMNRRITEKTSVGLNDRSSCSLTLCRISVSMSASIVHIFRKLVRLLSRREPKPCFDHASCDHPSMTCFRCLIMLISAIIRLALREARMVESEQQWRLYRCCAVTSASALVVLCSPSIVTTADWEPLSSEFRTIPPIRVLWYGVGLWASTGQSGPTLPKRSREIGRERNLRLQKWRGGGSCTPKRDHYMRDVVALTPHRFGKG